MGKIIIMVCKGILLYTTIAIIVLTIAGIEDLYDTGYLVISLILIIVSILLCKKILTEEDIHILTLEKYLMKDKEK